ncbi:hypothetical protein [Pimelobacter sp. 30-1]|uniref:hypothetical protein n=1 Tax=Pimelobacter sp. 30-1 TaxID=2004991 RepID=UPI001C04EDC1|nr:hypothetical protein [Pimelobacter sp. 30-1]MBU2698558.1 hypothetical protein [Pimelobacter sp. 30-1]
MKTLIRRMMTSSLLAVLAVAGVPVAAFAGPVPDPKPQAPSGLQDKVDLLLGLLKWGGIAAVVAGFIIAGIMLALGNGSGHGGREGQDRLWKVAAGAIVIGAASSIAGFFLA